MYRPSVDSSLAGEVVCRCGYENIVFRKGYGRAIWGMQAMLFDDPGSPAVPADTKPDRSRRDHNTGMNRVRAHFVDITVDVNGGSPGPTAICRARNASDMNIGQEHSAVRGCGHRTNPKRWSNALTIYQRRTCVPRVPSRNSLEAAERINRAAFADAEDARVVRSEIDHISDYHQACEVQLPGSDHTPHAIAGTAGKRVSIDNGESASITLIWCKGSHRVTGKFLASRFAGEDEYPVAPGGR